MDIKKKAIAATLFVHFKDPATNQPEYETNEAGEFVLDADGNKKPIGVRIYGPGSVQFRNAQAAIATGNIKLGKKGLKGEILFANETEILARTTAEFVNFTYSGQGANLENNRKFYDDVELVHYREQVSEAQGDLGNFTKSATND